MALTYEKAWEIYNSGNATYGGGNPSVPWTQHPAVVRRSILEHTLATSSQLPAQFAVLRQPASLTVSGSRLSGHHAGGGAMLDHTTVDV